MPTFPVLSPVPDDQLFPRIRAFLACRTLALAGVSRDGKGFGHAARKELLARGYQLRLIHPGADAIDGVPCARSLAEVAGEVDGLLIVTPPDVSRALLEQAVACGIRRVWLQQGAAGPEEVAFCEAQGLEAVCGRCILMFAQPPSFPHGFHRWILEVFGKVPREPAVPLLPGPGGS